MWVFVHVAFSGSSLSLLWYLCGWCGITLFPGAYVIVDPGLQAGRDLGGFGALPLGTSWDGH